MTTVAKVQEATLRERAEAEKRYGDLIYFYGAQHDRDAIDALLPDIDPKNQSDLLVFELFQGTEARALVAMLQADADGWVRYSLLKGLLQKDAFSEAMDVWRKALQWQNPDVLLANTLLQYALNSGHFEEAGLLLQASEKLAPAQSELAAWRTAIHSKTVVSRALRLDPLPPKTAVAFLLSTRDAAPYLADTLGAICAQSHPLADILVVDDGAMADLVALQSTYPFRILRDEGGSMPADVTATHFATVPTNGAPAIDFVQQFVLATENGPENMGIASGRLEDFYQDSPGDHWRVVRMTEAMPDARVTGPDAPRSEATFQPRTSDPEGTRLYLPEAVACGLQQDTIDSALTARWKSQLPTRNEMGHFKEGTALIASFDTHLQQCIAFINDDVDEGRTSLVFPDFLSLYHAVAMDAQIGMARGLFDEGTAAYIQQQVIQSIGELDKEYQRDLVKKVREALGERLLSSAQAPDVSPAVSHALAAFIQDLNALYNGMPQDLYLAIYG